MEAMFYDTPIRSPVKPGDRFGRWIVLEFALVHQFPSGQKINVWLCRCSCTRATEKLVLETILRFRHDPSCGCRSREQAKENIKHAAQKILSHGEARPATVEYSAWTSMLQRCYNPKCKNYKDYGGRGITVCDRWRHDYSAFLADMGRRPSEDHSLNRINNDDNYYLDNCEWSLLIPQQNNRRNNIKIEGIAIGDLARLHNIPYNTLWSRIRVRNWSLQDALSIPISKSSKIRHNNTCK